MNRTVRILLVLVVLAGAAYYLITKQGWTTMKRELRDFAIKDTGSVTKFFLADRKGGSVLVEKNAQGIWILNGKHKADVSKVNIVLGTMHDIEVRNPVAENEFNQVVAFLASDGAKAEFYAGDKHIKTIYVGPSTPDQTGTFMLIDGSSTPFVTHIPGFVGYLTPRFITEPVKWRSKEVFNTDAPNIRWVKVEYPAAPAQSFTIRNGTQPELLSEPSHAPVQADAKYLRYYLESFHDLFFEGFEENITSAATDSIRALQPLCIISMEQANGSTTTLRIHRKPVDRRTKEQIDEQGEKLPYDTEKYFAFLNEEKELLVIQDFSFSKVIKRMQDFAGNPQ